MLVLSALVLASEFGGWTHHSHRRLAAGDATDLNGDGNLDNLGLGEPRGERGADVLENGRGGEMRAPRRQCSAQI